MAEAHRAQIIPLLVLSHACIHAVVLPEHDLPGSGVLPEQGSAVVDDEGRDRDALVTQRTMVRDVLGAQQSGVRKKSCIRAP